MSIETCPRCGGDFECGAGGAGPCACATVRLDDDRRRALAVRYAGCLCLRCLAEYGRCATTHERDEFIRRGARAPNCRI